MQAFLAEEGIRLAYRDEGFGLPLLALAGLTRDGRDFDYLARHLPRGIRFLRLDSRGRGQSAWANPSTYTVAQEARDAVALLDHLSIARVAIIGSSRGGLVGMMVAMLDKTRVLGLCLNDVGPVLERDGLARIGAYVGIPPAVETLEEIADRLPAAMPGFRNVPELRWAEEAVRHFVQHDGYVGLPYDPALRNGVLAALSAPLPELWPLFDACEGLPFALIRGKNSDVLSPATVSGMRVKRPDMIYAQVDDRGHVPFLDEPEALDGLNRWLENIVGRLAPGFGK